MSKAVRAIIIQNEQILLMQREKENNTYFTLVGGVVSNGESNDDALLRKVREETSLNISSYRLVFIEEHTDPYNQQFIYLCETISGQIGLQKNSEEAYMNQFGSNMHQPVWVSKSSFASVPFRTPQLREAIIKGIKQGFPKEPLTL